MKKLLAILVSLFLLVTVIPMGAVSVVAEDAEYAMFPGSVLKVTQGAYGEYNSYSHNGQGGYYQNAFDLGGNSNYRAPFSGTISKIKTSYNAVVLQSDEKVYWANGVYDYMSVTFVHDNDISDLYVGKHINQGEVFYQPGVKDPGGYTTGTHLHMCVNRGKTNDGISIFSGDTRPNEAFFLESSVSIQQTGGYSWKHVTYPAPTPAYTYDPDAAIAYAKNHWNDGVGLCARFVSDCLKAGGFTGAYSGSVTTLVSQLEPYGTKITCSGWSAGAALKATMFNGTLSKGDVIIWQGPNAGHAMLYSGKTDSAGKILVYAHNAPKNEEVAVPDSSFTTVYAIHIPSTSPIIYASITTGTYSIKNNGTGRYLCISEGKDVNKQNVGAGISDGSVAQKFEITPSTTTAGYMMRPLCSASRVINVYGDTVSNGSDVCLWDNTGHDSQRWNFEAVDGGYVIRNVQSPGCVLTVQSNNEVRVQTYTGADSQIWTLENVGCKHTYDNACDTICNTCGVERAVDSHTYDGKVTVAATCGADGVKTYTCSACGDSYTEAIPATGDHIYDDDYDATCNTCGDIREVPEKPPVTPDLPADAPAFVVESTTAREGEEFTIAIRTERNSGIVSFKLNLIYDAAVLELVSVEEKDFVNVSFGPTENNPFVLNWVDALHPNNSTDGVVALVTFRVKEGADLGKTEIALSYDADDVYDQNYNNVAFRVENGYVEIVDYVSGDVNGDGKINNKDLGLLQQYVNGWTVTVSKKAADANGDGKVNNKDLGLLQQYLNGWNVELG